MSSPISIHSSPSTSIEDEEESSWKTDSPIYGKPSENSGNQKTRSDIIKKLFPKEKSPEPAPKHESNIMIAGVKVILPVKPYSTQIALMHQVIKTIKAGQNCLLESPTGSGKTLALLCGTLAWLESEKDRINNVQFQDWYDGSEHTVNNATNSPGSKKHVQGAYSEVNFSKPEYSKRSIYSSPSKFDTGNKQYAISPGGSSGDRKMDIDSSGSDVNPFQTPKKMSGDSVIDLTTNSPRSFVNVPQKQERIPTIYYGTRTHKQLQQVIKEFKRTAYCKKTKMTLLSSRDKTCLKPLDRNTWKTKDEMCTDCTKTKPNPTNPSLPPTSNCKFYDNRTALTHKHLPSAFDIEDLIQAGDRLTACPYFAAKLMTAKAKIIFCPYNYLISPFIKERMRINLKDNIVIIDEGHNIEDICREAATCSIERRRILEAANQLQIAKKYVPTGKDSSARGDTVGFLIETLQKWDNCLTKQSDILEDRDSCLWTIQDFINILNKHGIGADHYYTFNNYVSSFLQIYESLYGVTQTTVDFLETLDSALGHVFNGKCKHAEDFIPMFVKDDDSNNKYRKRSHSKEPQGANISIRLLCMSPSVLFEGLTSARTIILASGTLSPIISLKHELGAAFNVSCLNHIIPRERVWIGTLTNCENGAQLKCTKDNLEKKPVQDSIGKAILRVCEVTPHGVLCFHSSYSSMRLLHQRWQQTGLWDKLNRLKYIFKESDNATDHEEIMKSYYGQIEEGGGAILFAVYRGKVSEGMDFKDRQARAVITIGVPFPMLGDEMVSEKMNYNNKFAQEKNLVNGREWYNVQAFRAMNQAIGRCVRHLHDWGAVLMIDNRIGEQRNLDYLSKWVRDFLGNNHLTFAELMHNENSLTEFMENMMNKE